MSDSEVGQRERDDMVAFAVRWAPFGGGSSEDIFITFGLAERTYFQRLHTILGGPALPGLDDLAWHRLRQVCAQRLADADPDRRPPRIRPA